MTRILLALGVAGALALPAPASAAKIRECGHNVTGHWSYDDSESGAGVWNLTTRKVRCHYARWFVYHDNFPAHKPHRGMTWHAHGYRCKLLDWDYEYADTRCTASRRRVIHWQSGS
jgi:hypothetical protein